MIRGILQNLSAVYRIRKDPSQYARSIGVDVGKDCRFLGLKPTTFGSEPFLISIGDHVTITSGVKFVTHDGGVWVFREEHPDIDVFGRIQIGDNVFVGINSIIMPGVTVGSNVVIGAGSIVTRDIPSNSVVAGVPAKVIRPLNEYRARIMPKASFFRSKPRDVKKALIIEHLDRVQDAH